MRTIKFFSLLGILLLFCFYDLNAQVVKVVNNRVGIGTTSPSYKLHVAGDIYGNWIRTSGQRGLYSQSYGIYFYAINKDWWYSRSDLGISIRNKGNTRKGAVYHNNSNGFGLLDGDGNWAHRIERDNYHQFVVNNIARMYIYSNGRTEIPNGGDATSAQNTGHIEVGNALRIDGNEMITNSGASLYLQNDNNGDLFVDGGTVHVDASANQVGIPYIYDRNNSSYYLNPNSISRVSWMLPLSDNAGYCGSSASTWGYGYFNRLYRTYEYSLSDERAKENIRGIDNPLSKIMQLDGKLYNYRHEVIGEQSFSGFSSVEEKLESALPPVQAQTEREYVDHAVEDEAETPAAIEEVTEVTPETLEDFTQNEKISSRDAAEMDAARTAKPTDSYGFIAQEVLQVLPEAVEYDKENDVYAMSYTAIIPVMVEAMKEQQQMIDNQQQMIEQQQKQIDALLLLIKEK